MGYFRRTVAVPLTLLTACWAAAFLLRVPPAAVAAPADAAANAQAITAPTGEAAVRAALERSVSVSFAGQPFSEVLSWLKQTQRLNVAVDGEHANGSSELNELLVTFTAQDLPLGETLKRLLADLDLAYEVRDDILLITTRERESTAEVRAYDVRDLAATRGAFDEVEYDCRPLIGALMSTVARGHWTEYGADNAGSLRGALLVSQSAEVHEKIDQCLVALRQARERQIKKPGGEAIRVESLETAKVQAAIRRKLECSVSLRFSETPLSEALRTLRDAQDLPIELDTVALHELGESNDFNVTLQVLDVPLRSALKRMLGRMGLAYVIREQTLLVTTGERAIETQRTVVYPVRDLIEDRAAADGSDDLEAFESLTHALAAVVAPGSWASQGGSGELFHVPGASAFVCLQSDQAHLAVEQTLAALRAGRAKRSSDAALVADDALRTKVHKLQPAAIRGERAAAELTRLITERIEPQSWVRTGTLVSLVGDRLVVRQTAAAQQQIVRLLRKLEILAGPEASVPPISFEMADPDETAPGAATPAAPN